MAWEKCTFGDAILMLLAEFDRAPATQSFALLWRSGEEYCIMDNWWVKRVLSDMDEKTLRVVLWMTRSEAIELTNMLARRL